MAITQWQQIVDAALRNLKVIPSGGAASAAEYADCLNVTNTLIGSLSAQAIPIPYLTSVSVTLTGGQSYTLPTRPLKIEAAQVLLNSVNVARPVRVVPVEEWNAFEDQSAIGAYAEILWWDAVYPNSKVWLAPMPRTGATLLLQAYMPLTQVVAWTDPWNLPPGYDRMFIRLLQLEFADQFGVDPTQEMISLATEAKNSILALNAGVLGPPNPIVPPAPQVAQSPASAQSSPAPA